MTKDGPRSLLPGCRVSHLQGAGCGDGFLPSAGGVERNVSPNIVAALDYAKSVGASILGIVGRDGGYTARVADVCVLIPTVSQDGSRPMPKLSGRCVALTCVSPSAPASGDEVGVNRSIPRLVPPFFWIVTEF